MRIASFSFALILLLTARCTIGEPGSDLLPPPPMGWNSWNWFGKEDINEKIVREVIDAMVEEGLRDAGYRYVIVDGGWRTRSLGQEGELQVHPEKFPGGIKALADYAHSRGMKFGLHTVPGTHDCGGDQVGGYGREKTHVSQFVDWGIDFIKVDKCMLRGVVEEIDADGGGGWSEEVLEESYTRWRKELDEQAPDMMLSISAYTFRDWYPGNSSIARTTLDIRSKVHTGGAQFDEGNLSVMGIAHQNNAYASFAGNGYWNDPDILAMGEQGLTVDEQRTHFALWCMMSAPLMLGNDPRTMTEEEKATVLNADAIAVDQDPTEQGVLISEEAGVELWAKKLRGNRVAALLINRSGTESVKAGLAMQDLGLSESFEVRDIYSQEHFGRLEGEMEMEIPPHGCRFLLLSPN